MRLFKTAASLLALFVCCPAAADPIIPYDGLEIYVDGEMSKPDRPTISQGSTSGGSCSNTKNYIMYVSFKNATGETVLSEASNEFRPTANNSKIYLTRPTAPYNATLWRAWFANEDDGFIIKRGCGAAGAELESSVSTFTVECLCSTDTDITEPSSNTTAAYFYMKTTATYEEFEWDILPIPSSATPPTTDCDEAREAGRIYMDTNATTGQRIYGCEGATGWVLQGDGGGGSNISFDATNDAVNESTAITHVECTGNGLTCAEATADEAQIALNIGTGATQVSAGNHTHSYGSDTQVLYSASGTASGDAGLTYSAAGDDLTVVGTTTSGDFATSGSTAGTIVLTEDSPGTNKVTLASQASRSTDIFANFPDEAVTDMVVLEDTTQTLTDKTIDGGDGAAGTTRPAGSNIMQMRTHNTDCQSLTDGKQGELCGDEDDGKIWICIPSAGDCSSTEWKRVDSTGGSPTFDAIASGTNTTAAMVVDTGASLAVPTASANDDDTSAASTAFVQQELNAAGGRSLACAAGSCDADAELYRDTKCMTIESPADVDNFLFLIVEANSTVIGIDCLTTAATNIPVTVQECDASGGTCGTTEAAITCDTSGPNSEAAGIDDAAWDAGDWIRLDMGTPSGTPTQLSVCVTYTVND